jgi:hypothetical protein
VLAGSLAAPITINAAVEGFPISTSGFVVLSRFGEELPGAISGDIHVIEFSLKSNSAHNYVAIVELRDKDGTTSQILLTDGTLEPGQSVNVRLGWVPVDLRALDARVYVLSSLESPVLLSDVLTSDVTVVGSQSELDALKPINPVVTPTEIANEIPVSKGYTLLVYMVASDLESTGYYATKDILEMMSVGSTDNVNVIVQTGGSASSTLDGIRFIDFTRVQRHYVLKNDVELLQDLGKMNMAESMTLLEFVNWGVREYPADRYAIILWDHGSGMKGFGYDDIYHDILDLSELREGLSPAMNQGKMFELIGFDACLMASLEVANSLTGRGKYLVASEELEPAWGMDYEAILSAIDENPDQDGIELGKVISDSYMAHARQSSEEFDDYSVDKTLTMSVIDLQKIPALFKEVDSVGGYLDRLGSDLELTHSLTKSIRQTERYGETGKASTGHLDLYHLSENIDREFPEFLSLGSDIRRLVKEAVVYKVGGDARQDSYGISMFMQIQEYESNAPHLRYVVGKWASVLTSARAALAGDSTPPYIYLNMRKDQTITGHIDGIDLDSVYTFIVQEVDGNRDELKILSVIGQEAADFATPDNQGIISYSWNKEVMSLCNGAGQDCKPVSMTFEENGRTRFAYTAVRLESDRFKGTLWLIYAVDERAKFEFLGGWPGLDENGNAPRELVPIVQGDRIYLTNSVVKYNVFEGDSYTEKVEDPNAIVVADNFGPALHKYPGEYKLVFSACDFSGNCAGTDFFDFSVD